jgi:hypothetical protein
VEHSRSSDKKRARIVTIGPALHEDGTQTSETSSRPKSNENNGLGADDASDDPVCASDNIVRTSSVGNSLLLQGNGRTDVSDDVPPTPQGRQCAYCGEADPPPQKCSWNGQQVMLHLDCEEYWARKHEAD